MKKILTLMLLATIQLVTVYSLFGHSTVKAEHISPTETPCSNFDINTQRCLDNNTYSNTAEIQTTVSDIAQYALIAISILSAIFLIYGGVLFAVSAGNPDKIKKAKYTVLFSLIGLSLALLTNVIIRTVVNTAGSYT